MRLVNIQALATETALPVRTIRTLQAQGKIGFYKLGPKNVRYNPEQVMKDIEKFKVQPVS